MELAGSQLTLTIPVFCAAILLLFAMVFISFYGGKGKLPLILAGLALMTATWLFGFGMMYGASTREEAWFWADVGNIGVFLVPPMAYLFTVKFLDIMPQRVWLVLISWVGAGVFIVLQWQLHFVYDGLYDYWFGYYPDYTWSGSIYLIFHIFFLTLNIGEYINVLLRAREKNYFYFRAKRLFYVFLWGILAGADFLPGWGVSIYPLGYIVIFVAVLMLIDTVLRYRISGLTPDIAAHQIVDIMPNPLLVCNLDYKIHVANGAALAQLSVKGQLFQTDFRELLSSKSRERFMQLKERSKITNEVLKLYTHEGYASFSLSKAPINDSNTGHIIGYVLVAHNIEAYKTLQERLQTIASLPLNDPSPVYQISAKGEVIFANAVAEQWLQNWNQRFPESIQNLMQQALQENSVQQAEAEQQGFVCLFTAKKLESRDRVNLYGFDITARKRWERILEQVAREDSLTSLPNRRAIEEILYRELAHMKRSNGVLALLMFDLDHFKEVNDKLGHPVGDRLLYEAAQRINNTLRKEDILGRIGGDEFIAIIKPVHAEKLQKRLEQLTQRFIEVFTDSFSIEGTTLNITTSIGIVIYPEHGTSYDSLMENVDKALRQAKSEGKNTYRFYASDTS